MGGFFSGLTSFLSPFFMNPAVFLPGAALISAPIIIHLLNRLRFRKVRFAAMAFLLQSQKQNKRRILFEQLLLLLLRILIVLLIASLIARLMFSPNQLALLRGEKSHQLVLLDNSASMQDRWGETTAFDEGKKIILKLVEEGSQRPGTQKLTVILLSEPDRPFILGEDINEQLLIKLAEDLETLEPSSRALNLIDGLQASLDRLNDLKAVSRTANIITDFRESDWNTQPALKEMVKSFEEADIAVNLVRSVTERHQNLSLVGLSGDLQTAAVNVPLRLTAQVRNHSQTKADGVRLTVIQDGKKLPVAVPVAGVEAGETVAKSFDVVFATPGRHQLEVLLDSDALDQDNSRFLTLNLKATNPVLLIDGDQEAKAAAVVADALAADPTLTGIAPLIQSPDYLRRNSLENFRCIYLINVGALPADAIVPLENYVASGGGLAWFVGELTDPRFINDTLIREDENSLFPVPLAPTWSDLPRASEFSPGPDLEFTDHPLFTIFQGEENPFVAAVHVDRFFPVAEEVTEAGLREEGRVQTLVTLRNDAPIMFEHSFGQGKIITTLTSAGNAWNDWSTNPSFVIFQLELQKYLAKRYEKQHSEEVGTPIELAVDAARYSQELEIISPNEQTAQLQMTREEVDADDDSEDFVWKANFTDTNDAGVYRVTLFDNDQLPEERWIAYNPPVTESSLKLLSKDDLEDRVGQSDQIAIQSYDDLSWLQQADAQQEARMSVLAALFLIMMFEQFLAYRLSYHTRTSGA
ncbi:MAG: BatA domain-containing protein [Planctomycetaceae bacterium]|nr:BatA domain-containing protein [Planctomycetaceae bacterium]